MALIVHFDLTMCCALTQAFIHHPRLIARWGQFDGKMRLLADVLPRSLHLDFSPNDRTATIYGAFADAEIQRLADMKAPDGFKCKHTRRQHEAALQAVLNMLPKPTVH